MNCKVLEILIIIILIIYFILLSLLIIACIQLNEFDKCRKDGFYSSYCQQYIDF